MKPRVSLEPEQNVPGTHLTVACPNDPAHHLVVRENSLTGHTFLGCAHYPDCDGTAEIVLIDPNQTALF